MVAARSCSRSIATTAGGWSGSIGARSNPIVPAGLTAAALPALAGHLAAHRHPARPALVGNLDSVEVTGTRAPDRTAGGSLLLIPPPACHPAASH